MTAFLAVVLIMVAAPRDSQAQQALSRFSRRPMRPGAPNPGVGLEFRRQDAVSNSTGPTLSVTLPGEPPRRLVVVPQCGLGDRLMVLSRADDLARRLDGAQLYFNWYPAGNVRMTAEMAFDLSTLPPSFAMASLSQRADLGVYGSCLPAEHCRDKMRNLFPSESKPPDQ